MFSLPLVRSSSCRCESDDSDFVSRVLVILRSSATRSLDTISYKISIGAKYLAGNFDTSFHFYSLDHDSRSRRRRFAPREFILSDCVFTSA